ncbi:MAG: (d)CMP kinase [Gammaproteobacteria bacterium]
MSSPAPERDTSPVIAVDGPSGTGKGALCQRLAGHLHWHLLDSGAVYRSLTYLALNKGACLENPEQLARLADGLDIRFLVLDEIRVLVGGEDVTEAIRAEECGSIASRIAEYPAVRQALLAKQRVFRKPPGLIADGRDMGTVVFPGAALKLYLTASPEERAGRRYKQLKEKGIDVSLQHLSLDIAERDRRDCERVVAPLRAAPNAVIIDTTEMGIEAVVRQAMRLIAERGLA